MTPRRTTRSAALLLAAGLVFSGASALPAAAVGNTTPSTLTAAAQPDVGRNLSNQVAGDLKLAADTTTTEYAVGEEIALEVADADGLNCSEPERFVGFASTPTITTTGSLDLNVEVRPSTSPVRGGTGCDGFSPTVNDQLVLTVSVAGRGPITISNIRYGVGALAAVGGVRFVASDSDGQAVTVTGASNAYVTNVLVTAGGSASVTPGSGRSIPDVELVERDADATTPNGSTGAVCLVITSGNATFTTTNPRPTVSVTAGSDSAGGVDFPAGGPAAGAVLRFAVAQGEPTRSTFVVDGIRLDTVAGNFGTVAIEARQCTPGGVYSPQPITQAPATSVTAYTGSAIRSVSSTPGSAIVRRFEGGTRYETAADIARRGTWSGGANCSADVVLARGDAFADALAGGYLAGDVRAPILLTTPTSVPQVTLDAIRDLGARRVHILGGTSAVSAAVASQLAGTPARDCSDSLTGGNIAVDRIGGGDRYETAAAVAIAPGTDRAGRADLVDDATASSVATAIVASGDNFPDALAASPLAYQGVNCGGGGETTNADCRGFPLLLTRTNALPDATKTALGALSIRQVLVVGGTAAVSSAVESQLTGLGVRVIRVQGADRQATAIELAKLVRRATPLGLGWDCATVASDPDVPGGTDACPNPYVNLARGDAFPDALTFGPHAGAEYAPVLLTVAPSVLGSSNVAYLQSVASTVDVLHVAGGTAAVSASAAGDAAGALAG